MHLALSFSYYAMARSARLYVPDASDSKRSRPMLRMLLPPRSAVCYIWDRGSKTMDFKSISDLFFKTRWERDMSQSALAAKLRVSRAMIGHVETGVRVPSDAVVADLLLLRGEMSGSIEPTFSNFPRDVQVLLVKARMGEMK